MIYAVSVIFFILLILAWWSIFFEPYHFKIERVVVKLKNLPQSFDGVKIVQLSDIHTKKFGKKERKILSIVGKLKFDYCVITGDIIDKKTKYIELCKPFWQALSKQCRHRLFAVFGNHVHENHYVNVHDFENIMRECGIDVLVNENRKLKIHNDVMYIVGVDDPHTKHHDLKKAFQNVDHGASIILLAHSSEIMEDVSKGQVDLILSGHTHGGQVKFPFIRPFWNPTIYHGKYNKGLFAMDDYMLYVNRGIGTDVLPIRFNSPPEITIIELQRSG